MRTFSLITAWVFHAVLTASLTVGVIYGEYLALKAFPALDVWIAQVTGSEWTSFILVFAFAFAFGREVSFHFVSRVILPWLDPNRNEDP